MSFAVNRLILCVMSHHLFHVAGALRSTKGVVMINDSSDLVVVHRRNFTTTSAGAMKDRFVYVQRPRLGVGLEGPYSGTGRVSLMQRQGDDQNQYTAL